jgi:predicted component of type VI protein secretion system
MHLVIRTQSPHHASVSQSIVAEFDERGGTIGRSDSNTMTLPDPARHVSRLQAEVSCAAGMYSLRNVGNANPIIVNGRPLGHGETASLRDQDQVTIGGYELRVELREQAAQAPLRAVDGRTVIGASAREAKTGPPRQPGAARTPMQSDPFAGLLSTPGKPDAADPFADLLGPASSPAAPAPARVATPPQSPPRLPDDFDPFADLAAPALPPAARGDQEASLRGMLDPGAAAPGIDTLFGLNAARPGQVDALEAFLSPGSTTDAPSTNDPFAFLGVGDLPSDAVGPAAGDDTPDLQAAYTPPPVHAAMPPRQPQPARPQAAEQALATDSDTDALWDAFCDGAQLSLPTRPRLTPELMRLIGGTLRQAVEGTLQLSAMRTVVKQELHVPVTTIQARGNNPLKFAPDAAAALAQMVQPPMRGFMAAPEAMQDAMTDLLGHAAGTMEGTRAALQGMLRRFEPTRLETQLAEGGVLDKLMPGNRRARLWELYLQHFGRISESAREDFDELFGKAFVKAYEEQADRVAAARRNNAAR